MCLTIYFQKCHKQIRSILSKLLGQNDPERRERSRSFQNGGRCTLRSQEYVRKTFCTSFLYQQGFEVPFVCLSVCLSLCLSNSYHAFQVIAVLTNAPFEHRFPLKIPVHFVNRTSEQFGFDAATTVQELVDSINSVRLEIIMKLNADLA